MEAGKPINVCLMGFIPSRCCWWNPRGDPGAPADSSHSAEPDCPGNAPGNVLEKALSSGNVPVILIPIKRKAFLSPAGVLCGVGGAPGRESILWEKGGIGDVELLPLGSHFQTFPALGGTGGFSKGCIH